MSGVKVEIYQDKMDRLNRIIQQAFEMTVQAVLTDAQMSQTIPKETGELEGSGFFEVDVKRMVAKIIFDTPYARRLYWHPEYNFRTDKNPHAGGLWMQPYIDGPKSKFVETTFSMFVKLLGGGMIS